MRLLGVAALVGLVAGELSADDKKPDRFDDIDPVAAKVDVPSLIRVRTAEDVARVRKELIAFIWKNDGRLPTSAEVVRAGAELPKPLANSQATCETLTVAMEPGFKSVVYHFIPKTPNKRLAIFHQGHDHAWASGGGADTVAFLLEKGYSVMVFQMPLFGDNKRFSPVGIGSHDAMAKLASRDLEPIKFFVEPVAVALNYAAKQSAPEDVVMIGLSGGGWTTTLYAALDPRVRLSFPVAGTLPDYLRVGRPGDKGDWEQFYPDLYKIANYLDLYVMGSSGQGRRQRQVLNKYDTCCFWGVGYRTYEKHVAKTVAGAFDVYLDESHRSHLVSRDALKEAVGPLLDAPRKP
jgi:dienelactone hydrolase